MKKKYFLNANIIDPQNSVNEFGGLIIDENGKIEAAGKKVTEDWIKSTNKKGLDAQKLLDTAKSLISKYEKSL